MDEGCPHSPCASFCDLRHGRTGQSGSAIATPAFEYNYEHKHDSFLFGGRCDNVKKMYSVHSIGMSDSSTSIQNSHVTTGGRFLLVSAGGWCACQLLVWFCGGLLVICCLGGACRLNYPDSHITTGGGFLQVSAGGWCASHGRKLQGERWQGGVCEHAVLPAQDAASLQPPMVGQGPGPEVRGEMRGVHPSIVT